VNVAAHTRDVDLISDSRDIASKLPIHVSWIFTNGGTCSAYFVFLACGFV